MTLREKQSAFAQAVAALILHAKSMGYEVTFGETWRPPETADLYEKQGKGAGGKQSLHCQRLAIDLNLFSGGKYLTSTEAHRPLGEWWVAYGASQGLPLRWGGNFTKLKDGNHYSLEHGGRQ